MLVRRIEQLLGITFDVDACADPMGFNRHAPRFWSMLEPAAEQVWRHLMVWCNPPFDHRAVDILRRAREHHESAPLDTGSVFMLPYWPTHQYWRHLKGHRLVAVIPAGTRLFTAPPNAHPSRRDVGPTQWPVALTYLAPHSLMGNQNTTVPDGPRDVSGLPALHGEVLRDTRILRGLQQVPLWRLLGMDSHAPGAASHMCSVPRALTRRL